ncbi:MAG: glycine--tRNA ligase subunit beta [Nitrospirae bacterium]|nr:glycine--tRNA ligase subunit beta [Nitrospirota bacterium]MDA8214904.1 glycine--tRNA ligase subunit beta [Nitrospiraceae bacterium]
MNNQQNFKIETKKSSPLPTSHLPLLLEIGTEEIPARFLPDTIIKLKENSEKIFSEYRLSCKSMKTYATPRRLSMIAEIDPSQEAAEKEIWGPPVNAAFDKDGKPTKAAEAFAKTHGLRVKDLIKKEKGKGNYVVAVIKEAAQQTIALLPELLQKLILSLNFPKSMRWGSGSLRFARPIHWILATYGNNRITFEIDGLKSSNMARGHRFLSPAAFEIKDCKAYINLLRNNFVILDADERRKVILDGAKKLASSVNASLIEDAELLQHVSYLVEYPVPVIGTFQADYLYLPKELLITVMKGHQKYFALEDAQGKLANYFIIISNTKQDNAETIKKGAEKVIRARFEDARFYFEEDKRIPLRNRLDDLKKVIYHERLGSLYDKSLRISSIADFIADKCCLHKKEDIHTAAILSKTDLISGVVGEFPELQGIMGGYYALNDGHNEEVSKALAEQYLPAHSGDRLPETDIGTILSLSDKLDNMASFFMLGLTPTGTEDPFALRRQALGIISILIKSHYNLNISELLDKSLQPFEIDNKEELMNNLIKFFEQRIEPFFTSSGYPMDSISAILNFVKSKPLYTIKERLDALQKFKEDADYEPFLLAIKRVNNIAPKNDTPPVNPELFQQEEEAMLYKELESITPQINSLINEDRYYDAIKALMTLKEPINRFFDKVLVMDKKEEIKQNRLSLIKNIQTLALQIADFSKLA